MRPADTTLEAQRFQWDTYAGLGAQRRFELLNGMCRSIAHPGRKNHVENSLEDFLIDITERLDVTGIPYMIVGSVAAGIWAAPRYTQDLDVVVKAGTDQALELAQSFDDNFYVGDLVAAAARLDMANVINPTTGWKADFIWARETEWDTIAFTRRVPIIISGKSVSVCSAEDLVIAKLRWAQSNRSEMQLRDVANLLGVAEIDRDYLDKWVGELGLEQMLAKAATD